MKLKNLDSISLSVLLTILLTFIFKNVFIGVVVGVLVGGLYAKFIEKKTGEGFKNMGSKIYRLFCVLLLCSIIVFCVAILVRVIANKFI